MSKTQYLNQNFYQNLIRKRGEKMENIEEIARQLRNKKVREWRKNNKDKVKEINHRYWIKQAEKLLEKGE